MVLAQTSWRWGSDTKSRSHGRMMWPQPKVNVGIQYLPSLPLISVDLVFCQIPSEVKRHDTSWVGEGKELEEI